MIHGIHALLGGLTSGKVSHHYFDFQVAATLQALLVCVVFSQCRHAICRRCEFAPHFMLVM